MFVKEDVCDVAVLFLSFSFIATFSSSFICSRFVAVRATKREQMTEDFLPFGGLFHEVEEGDFVISRLID